ncbi:MAG: SDR family oxidoreductase [Thermoleophilia bacterium]|nr:SDR family oxidoreductase [Thermoleophilia bacterium]
MLAADVAPEPTGPGEPCAADLSTREGNRAAVAAAVDAFGGVDAVVANAGFQHVSPFESFDEDRWDALLAVLLTSPFLLARYAWPHLRESEEGRVVVVASVHGLIASPFKTGYVAAKHGAVGLVKSLALEGAPDGIRAVALCPGFVRTPLVALQIAALAESRGITEEEALRDVLLEPQAIKRMLEPEEVADVAAFLLGPGGRSFTGSPVVMDSGWLAR